MGRDYIGERTIADPRMRAAEKARRRRLAAQRRAAEAVALGRYKERTRWCTVPGCGRPRASGELGFWACCSEACMVRWQAELQRRDDVAQARRLGIPVAQLRAARHAAATATGPAVPARDDDTLLADAHMTPTPLPRYCLIACSGTKATAAAPAALLYQGDLFIKSLAWARRQGFTEVGILSAKHGLVPLDQVLEPYDESLVKAAMVERRRWAEGVLDGLQQRWALATTPSEITVLAGQRYTVPLVDLLMAAAPRTEVLRPLAGLGIGRQKGWLANRLRDSVEPLSLHPAGDSDGRP